MTPVVARRAWIEPRVRGWYLAALALLAVALYSGAVGTWKWSRDTRLIRHGTRVDAVVWEQGMARVKGRPQPDNGAIELIFPWNGQERTVSGRLVGRDQPTFAGQTVPVYVDPDDPTRWTLRTTPPAIWGYVVEPIVLVALALPLIAMALYVRSRVMRTWRDGEARLAAVVETRQTALAPRSRLVRCTLVEGADRRLIDVYVPRPIAECQPGERLWLVMLPGRPEKALPAAPFASR